MKKRLMGLIAAGSVGAATLVALTGTAQASAPIECTAGSKDAGTACVIVNTGSGASDVQSVKIEGQSTPANACLTLSDGTRNGSDDYFGNVAVPVSGGGLVVIYSQSNCSGTPITYKYPGTTWSGTAGEDTNFTQVFIK